MRICADWRLVHERHVRCASSGAPRQVHLVMSASTDAPRHVRLAMCATSSAPRHMRLVMCASSSAPCSCAPRQVRLIRCASSCLRLSAEAFITGRFPHRKTDFSPTETLGGSLHHRQIPRHLTDSSPTETLGGSPSSQADSPSPDGGHQTRRT